MGALNDNIMSSDSEPEDVEITVENVSHQSSVLARWLALFLLRIQVVHRLSDGVIACLLKFLWAFLNIVGQFCAEIAKVFPSSIYKAKNVITKPKIRQYVVCRKCHTLYYKKDCVIGANTAQRGKTCTFKRYPSHPQHRMRAQCGLPLLKTVELAGG